MVVFKINLGLKLEFDSFKVFLSDLKSLLSAFTVPRSCIEAFSTLEKLIPGFPKSVIEGLFVLVPTLDVLIRYDILLELGCYFVDIFNFDCTPL